MESVQRAVGVFSYENLFATSSISYMWQECTDIGSEDVYMIENVSYKALVRKATNM